MGKNRHSLQISREAYQTLSQLTESSGVSYTELIDHLLGIKKNQSLSKPVSVTKVKSSLRNSTPKPPQAVIDTSILMCWRNYTERDYEYWVGSDFTRREIIIAASYHLTKNINLSLEYRKFIMANSFTIDDKISSSDKPKTINPFKKSPVKETISTINQTWADIYPRFFKDHLNHKSNFQIYFDNRLNALVKKNYIVRRDDGLYSINKNGLTTTDWTVIQGVYNLSAQKHLNIPQLF